MDNITPISSEPIITPAQQPEPITIPAGQSPLGGATPPVVPPEPPNRNWSKWLMLFVGLALLLYGSMLGYDAYQKSLYTPLPEVAITPEPTPTPTPDPTADWKTYTTSIISFKYPPTYIVQERVKNFYAIVPSGITPAPTQGIFIDARLERDNADYDKAVSSTTQSGTGVTTKAIKNGIIISGKVGPGMGEGLSFTNALLKYKKGAIGLSADPTIPSSLFEEIISNIKFMDSTSSLDTSTWKTYTGKNGEFTIKYPREKFVQLICANEQLLLTERSINDTSDIINMETCARDSKYTVEGGIFDGIQQHPIITNEFQRETYNYTEKNITINGLTAKEYILTLKPNIQGPYPKWTMSVYAYKNNKSFVINFGKEENKEIYNQIVSTLKFTP